jgi:hypothetical protein
MCFCLLASVLLAFKSCPPAYSTLYLLPYPALNCRLFPFLLCTDGLCLLSAPLLHACVLFCPACSCPGCLCTFASYICHVLSRSFIPSGIKSTVIIFSLVYTKNFLPNSLFLLGFKQTSFASIFLMKGNYSKISLPFGRAKNCEKSMRQL